MYFIYLLFVVQSLNLILWSHGLQHTRLPCPPLYICALYICPRGSEVKNQPAMQEIQVRFQGWEDPLEEGMAAHSSILTWSIPWTEKPGRLQSVRLQSDMTEVTEHTHMHTHTHACTYTHTHAPPPTHTHTHEPVYCTPETNLTLWIKSTSIIKGYLFNEIMECVSFGTSCINKCRCVYTHTQYFCNYVWHRLNTAYLKSYLGQNEHS